MGYFFRFWVQVIRTALYIISSRKTETRRAYALLSDIEKRWKGTFVPATRRKIAISYGIFTPMICDAFTALHGRKTNPTEKERFIRYFICSSLFDDFTDISTLPENELFALSFQPESFIPRTFDESVFKESHLLLKGFVRDANAYEKVTRELFQSQWASKRQSLQHQDLHPSDVPSEAVLRDITFSKGGNSVLLCSFYLDGRCSILEQECWYRMGTIIQLTNDLFDMYKDLQDCMDTLPLRMKDARAFSDFFETQIKVMQSLIGQLPFPESRKRPFRMAMAGIYAFGLIALDQLLELQGSSPELPALGTLPRSALIIDMEKQKNRKRWLRYTYRYSRQLRINPLPLPSSGRP
jgi:hypothetical protein